MGFWTRLLITTLTILAIPYVMGGVEVDGVGTALLAALLLGFMNVTVKPILILFTLPLTVLSLGLFLFVVNAIVFSLVAALLPGIHVASFWSSLGASLIVSAVSWVIHLSRESREGRQVFIVRTGPPGSRQSRDLN